MVKGQLLKNFLCVTMSSILMSACFGKSTLNSSISSGSDDDSKDLSYQTAIGGDVFELSVSNGSTIIDLSDVEDGEDAVLVIYSYDSSTQSNSYSLSPAVNSNKSSDKNIISQNSTNDDPDLASDTTNVTSEFHDILRNIESSIKDEPLEDLSDSDIISAHSTSQMDIGDTEEFNVLSSLANTSQYETVTATLRYSTEYFNFFVDNRNLEAFSDNDLAKLAEDFADIIPNMHDHFGKESDVNGDGKFDVLFTQIVNKMAGTMGGTVTGFFYGIDLFENSKYPVSNEREIIFALVPDPKGEHGNPVSTSFAIENILRGVLPHEYQHMISFNQHTFKNGGNVELNWLNEGLSHFAEDFYSLDDEGVIDSYGLENPARVADYLSQISNVCFTCGSDLDQRGGSYLFIKYIYEQASLGNLSGVNNGQELIQDLLDTDKRGIENIVTALYGAGEPDSRFKEILGYFALAVYLSDSNQISDDRFGFFGIILRGLFKDNRGTFVNGPAIQTINSLPMNDSLIGNGISYLYLPSSLIQESEGVLEFNSSSSGDFGIYLIR